MSALDTILEHIQRIERRGAGVLLFGTGKWCGPTPGILLVHEVKTDTWNLPESLEDVAPEGVYLDPPADIAGYQVVRCVQFAPPAGEKYDNFVWSHPDLAVTCENHPSATAAIKQFIAEGGNSKGAISMESGLSPRDAQQKAQHVHEAFGDAEGAPPVLNGEGRRDYRIRLLSPFQKHSKIYKDVDLNQVQDETAFTVIEDSIYADTMRALHKDGELRAHKRRDASGREITRYTGRDGALWDLIHPPIRHVRRINTPGNGLH